MVLAASYKLEARMQRWIGVGSIVIGLVAAGAAGCSRRDEDRARSESHEAQEKARRQLDEASRKLKEGLKRADQQTREDLDKARDQLRHALTHRNYLFNVFATKGDGSTSGNPLRKWVRLQELSEYPLSRPQSRIAAMLKDLPASRLKSAGQ